MKIIDAVILLMLGLGAVVGFNRGFFKQTVSFVGLIVVVILSFMLKNPISVFMYEYLPFFKYGGLLKGIQVINIIVYELVAFLIVFAILSILLKLVVGVSSIVEKILNATIILGIPSKILGMIVGVLVTYVYLFIALVILTQPVFNITIVNESKYKDTIINSGKFLPGVAKSSIGVYDEVYELLEKRDSLSGDELNGKALDLFLEHKVLTVESADKLVTKNKLTISNSKEIIDKYR